MRIEDLMTILPRSGANPARASVAKWIIDDMPVSQVRQVMSWMIVNREAYRDSSGGINAIDLADAACRTFNLPTTDGGIPYSLEVLAMAVKHAD